MCSATHKTGSCHKVAKTQDNLAKGMQILESWCYTDVVHTNMMRWDEGRLTKEYHNLKQEKKNYAKEGYCSTHSW